MLTDRERDALVRWYSQQHVLDRARELYDEEAHEDLEEFLHKKCLLPLGRHDKLPDYLLNDDGEPLFKHDLNPFGDEEKWQDAIEVGWQVMEDKLGFSHSDVHRAIAGKQKDDWEAFLESVEQRKRERGE